MRIQRIDGGWIGNTGAIRSNRTIAAGAVVRRITIILRSRIIGGSEIILVDTIVMRIRIGNALIFR